MAELGNDRMSKLPELSLSSMDLSKQLDELLEYKRAQLKKIEQEHSALQIGIAQAKEAIRVAEKDAKYQQEVAHTKHKERLQAEADAIQAYRREVEALDQEVQGRMKEVELLEAKAAPIKEAMRKLADDRLAIEQQRLRNEDLTRTHDQLAASIEVQQAELAQLRHTVVEQQRTVTAQAHAQEARSIELERQAQAVALQLENLTALRETVDPKLKEITKLSEQAARDRQQAETINEGIKSAQADLDKKRADLSTLSSQLEAKGAALNELEARLKHYGEELRVKYQQAKAEKIEMAEPPSVELEKKDAA